MTDEEKAAEEWINPLARKGRKLKNVLKEMEPFSLMQMEVPFIIQLVENPKYDIGLFAGNVDLFTHDCIHVLLGRGLLPKDEAFVIGYTMGSTKKMSRWRRNLFMFCSKYLYPSAYKFGEEERFIFNMGVMCGARCKTDLSVTNFKKVLNLPLSKIRSKFKIDVELLRYCYLIEKRVFKKSKESQRLIN